jgi:hypothetical protein
VNLVLSRTTHPLPGPCFPSHQREREREREREPRVWEEEEEEEEGERSGCLQKGTWPRKTTKLGKILRFSSLVKFLL